MGVGGFFLSPPPPPSPSPGPSQAVLRVALKGEAQFAVLRRYETGRAAGGGLGAVPPPSSHHGHQPGLFLSQPSQPPPAERGILLHQPAQPRCRPFFLLLFILLLSILSAAPTWRLRASVLRGGGGGKGRGYGGSLGGGVAMIFYRAL